MRKFFCCFLTLSVLLVGSQQVSAFDFEQGGFYFNIVPPSDDKPNVEITFNPEKHANKEGSYEGKIVFPYIVEYQGKKYSVCGIGSEAFKYSQNITGIDWESSYITYIGDCAFEGVANVYLNEIYNISNNEISYTSLPHSVRAVGKRAFSKSGLTGFYDNNYADAHVHYGDEAFKDCAELKTVVMYNDIATECFSGCTALESVTVSGNSVGDRAFLGCSALTSEYLNVTDVEYIGDRAFENCSGLEWFYTGHKTRFVGAYAFAGCTGLKSFSFQGMTLRGNLEDSYSDTPIRIIEPGTTFSGCTNLKSGTIGQYIIDNKTEKLCDPFLGTNLTSISFTNFCLESAFNGSNYPQLESVRCETYIPPTVSGFTNAQFDTVHLYTAFREKYYESTFWNKFKHWGTCSEPGVIVTEHGGLYYCFSPYSSGSYVFVIANPYNQGYKGDLKIEEFKFGEKIMYPDHINAGAFDECTELTSIQLSANIGNNPFKIGYAAFEGCEKLSQISFPEKMYSLSIDNHAFSGCKSLSTLNFNKIGELNIEQEACSFCTSIKKVSAEMPSPDEDGYTYNSIRIGKDAFYKSGVETLSFPTEPGSFMTVEEGAFYGCNIEKLELPYSIRSIAEDKEMAKNPFGGNPIKEIVLHHADIYWPLVGGNELTRIETVEVRGEISDYCYSQGNWLTSGNIGLLVINPESDSGQNYGWLGESWNLDKIKCCNQIPVRIGTFTQQQYETIKVEVPKGTVDTYKQSQYWKDFYHISDTDDSGIENIVVDDATMDIYNLQGICVLRNAAKTDIDNLPSGIYISKGKKFVKY